MSKNHLLIKKMIYIVTLTAISVVLGLIEIPLGLPWLKLDLSEIVILISVLIIGTKQTFIVIVLKGLFRSLFLGKFAMPPDLFGELVAIIASSVIVLSYVGFAKLFRVHNRPMIDACDINEKTLKPIQMAVILIAVGIIFVVMMIGLNFLFITPIFLSLYGQLGFVQLESFHFSVFTILNDPGMTNVLGFDLSNVGLYWTYIITNYGLLNLSKIIITMLIFLPAKERIERMHLV